VLARNFGELQAADLPLDLLDSRKTSWPRSCRRPNLRQRLQPEAEEEIPERPVEPVTRPGDVWSIGKHRLICGDCRDYGTVARLFDGSVANVVITSPPYATQREYDPASGFKPVHSGYEYCEWFRDVAANVAAILADDGSLPPLNIKEHADDGERSLYVKDSLSAHRRSGAGDLSMSSAGVRPTMACLAVGVTDLRTHGTGVSFLSPAADQIPAQGIGHESEDCFDYNPNNPKSTSGSGLLGTGPRGAAADGGKNQSAWQTEPQQSVRRLGWAATQASRGLPTSSKSRTESVRDRTPLRSRRPLVEFFLLAFSDTGDVVFDPFMGSGTTMAAAALLDRAGYGAKSAPLTAM